MSQNEELSALMKLNPVPLIRHFAETNPKALKEQILKQEDGHKTFFISMISAYPDSQTQKDILNLCVEYGYDLSTATKGITDSSWGHFKKTTNKVPDYILAWFHAKEDVLVLLTQKLGKEKVLLLEAEGYPMLQTAYGQKRYDLIKELESMGVGKRSEFYKPHEILKIAENNAETLSFYWSQKNSSVSSESFDSVKNYLIKKLGSIHSASGAGDNYIVGEVKSYLDKELPQWPSDKQEELIAQTIKCKNPRLFSHALKVTKNNMKNYSPSVEPAWKYLGEATHQQFFHHFIDNATPLDSSCNGVNYLESITGFLNNIRYSGTSKGSYSRGAEFAKMEAITRKLDVIQNQDFWLSANPNDNNHPWFHTACKNPSFLTMFSNWLNVHPKEMNFYSDQKIDFSFVKFSGEMPKDEGLKWNPFNSKAVVKDLLQKTWLYKDETNTTCLEYFIKAKWHSFSTDKALDYNMRFFFSEAKEMFTHELKLKLFNKLLSGSSYKTDVFKVVFQDLKNSDEMDWKNFKLDDVLEKEIKRNNPDLLVEFRRIALDQMLPSSNKSPSVNKI